MSFAFRRAVCWIFGCVFAISPFTGPHVERARCLRCRRLWSIPRNELDEETTPRERPPKDDAA